MKIDLVTTFHVARDALGNPGADIRTRLVWDSVDPLVVTATFLNGRFHDLTDPAAGAGLPAWLLPRDLLADGGGCTEPAGWLIVWRSPEWIGLVLRDGRSPDRFLVLHAGAAGLQTFLNRTYERVPRGAEIAEGAVDAFIASCGGVTPDP